MNRNHIAVLVAAALVVLGVGAAVVATQGSSQNGAAAAAATPPTDTVSVSGTGSVEGVPDTLVAGLRVHVREASVQEALDTTAVDARKVLNALRSHGVSSKDVRTTDVSLDPAYNDHGAIVGYSSSESLSVRMHPLTHVGAILSAASTAAGNAVSVNGLSFDINDNTDLLAGARAAAFANAKAAAAQYASLGGTRLSHVMRITSVVHNASPIQDLGYAKAATLDSTAGRAAVPIRAGQQKVSVTVNVVWALQ